MTESESECSTVRDDRTAHSHAASAQLDVVIAGDDVLNKKPSPEIYNLAASRLGLPSSACAPPSRGVVFAARQRVVVGWW